MGGGQTEMKSERFDCGRGRKGGLTKESRAQPWRRHCRPCRPGPKALGLHRPACLALSVLWGQKCVQPPDFWVSSLQILSRESLWDFFFFWPGIHYSKPEITKLEFLSAESCDFFQALSHFRVLKLCMIRWSLTIPALSSCEGEESSGLFMTSEKQFPRWLFHSISFPHKFFTGRTI